MYSRGMQAKEEMVLSQETDEHMIESREFKRKLLKSLLFIACFTVMIMYTYV